MLLLLLRPAGGAEHRGQKRIIRSCPFFPPDFPDDDVQSFAQVATGDWACIVPHTWLWANPMAGDIRVCELVDPVLKAQIAVATSSAGPGSPVARAFSACAQKLALNDFFDARLLGITGRG